MRFIDLGRYRSVATVFGILIAGMIVVDAGLTAILGWAPSFLYAPGENRPQGFDVLETSYGRLAAIAGRPGTDRASIRFGIVAGMSTTEYGINLRGLETCDDTGLRYVKTVGSYASFPNLALVLAPIRTLGLRPERAVLGLHYGMFVGAPLAPGTFFNELVHVVKNVPPLNLFGEIGRAMNLTFLGENRASILNVAEFGLLHERDALFSALGQDFTVVYPPVADPHEDITNHKHPVPVARWMPRIKEDERRGWFNAESYRVDSVSSRAFLAILDIFESSPDVVLVLMPERSPLRSRIPVDAASALLRSLVARAPRPESIRIADLRAALPDSMFEDEAHATGEGNRATTMALCRALIAR